MKTQKNISKRGFTLIELLVVIGIIAALAAGVGLALRDNNPGAALRGAQGLTVSALSSARGQAALSQSKAKLIVQADKTNDTFLRAIRIMTTVDEGATWTQAGGEIVLPTGVYIVPNGKVDGLTLAGSGRVSTFFSNTAPATISSLDGKWISSNWISSLGVLTAGSGNPVLSGNIVVATGKVTGPDEVTFDNYEALRGVFVSRYGVATLVDDAASFGN